MLPIPKLSFDQQFKLWIKIDRKSNDQCWLWTGKKTGVGRPVIQINKILYVAARVLYCLHYDSDPGDLFVCHDCSPNPDNILCMNPEHFWLGTQQENTQDYFNKGGKPSCGNQRLLPEDYEKIFMMYHSGYTVTEIVEQFKISRRTVWYIATQKNF
jgi:Helix-turn-helix domain of resolvase